MRKSRDSSIFLLTLVGVIALALLATMHFFSEMNSKYILVANGYEPRTQILNSYKYDRNKKGLIFSVAFLISSTSFLVMVLLPNEERTPRRLAAAVPREEAPVREAPRDAAAHPPESSISSPVASVEEVGSEHISPPPPRTVKEPQVEAIDELDLEDVDFDSGLEITEGEDDVVYGSGEITAGALIDFVHKYPDSALKFLYRRKLDGKQLTQEEEDIYAVWEDRTMTRGKIKRYILQLMEWEEMPREPIYEIWKKLRDHIFEFYGP
ncbi:MAG: hypothetical protein RRB13_09280 [bacterium]|nr:hypothetical protein [bacterium]